MTTTMAYPWSFIKQYNFSNPPTIVLGRSEEVLERYKKHGERIKKNGAVEKHIKSCYLSQDNDYCMTKNNFPYYFEAGISHYVIWFKLETFKDYNNPVAVNKIVSKFQRDNRLEFEEYVFFQNIERLRSIPEIPHIHVFAKVST
jgi:hypothetical protein